MKRPLVGLLIGLMAGMAIGLVLAPQLYFFAQTSPPAAPAVGVSTYEDGLVIKLRPNAAGVSGSFVAAEDGQPLSQIKGTVMIWRDGETFEVGFGKELTAEDIEDLNTAAKAQDEAARTVTLKAPASGSLDGVLTGLTIDKENTHIYHDRGFWKSTVRAMCAFELTWPL